MSKLFKMSKNKKGTNVDEFCLQNNCGAPRNVTDVKTTAQRQMPQQDPFRTAPEAPRFNANNNQQAGGNPDRQNSQQQGGRGQDPFGRSQ